MGKEFDGFVEDLQNQIYEEARATYGDVAFERWLNPIYMGTIDNPEGYAHLKGSCSDTMQVFLNFRDGRVNKASFQTDGCASSVVCGSFAAEMAIGKDPDELLKITGDVILKKLGGLPKEDEHCAFLAGDTLQKALNDYMVKQREKNIHSKT